MALPEHEVGEPFHAGCANEEVEGRGAGGEHVGGEGVCVYCFGVGEDSVCD